MGINPLTRRNRHNLTVRETSIISPLLLFLPSNGMEVKVKLNTLIIRISLTRGRTLHNHSSSKGYSSRGYSRFLILILDRLRLLLEFFLPRDEARGGAAGDFGLCSVIRWGWGRGRGGGMKPHMLRLASD